ncbi:MAG: sulfatase-like hydrolase/transferase [Candidatus Latescibacterota bacterium]
MTRPNILLICTDQQSASAMSCAGNIDLHTPGMDRLAAEGVRFSRAYCTQPLCAPVRSSFITGLMPSATGVIGNKVPMDEELRERSLARLVGDAGYRCALAGKWHVPGATPQECGFEVLSDKIDSAIPEVSADFLQGSEPFFLFASFRNPHDICQLARSQPSPQGPIEEPPIVAECPNLPANFEEPAYGPEMLRYSRRWNPSVYPTEDFTPDDWRRLRHGYFRLVEKVDAEVVRLLDALFASGREKETLVVFMSDHGDGHGAHRWNQKTAFWEEVINIPFIARWPGMIDEGRVDERLVSTGLDLLPTLCDVAGARAPADLTGMSLVPLLEGDKTAQWRDELVVETTTGIGGGPGGPAVGRALVGERYKYSCYSMGRWREQLVDLQTDPGEMVNLAVEGRHAGLLAQCRASLRAGCKAVGDSGGEIVPA